MARRAQVAVGVAATLVLAGTTAVLPNAAEAASAPPPALAPADPQPTAHASRPEVAPAQRDTVLGKGWRSSTDIAWTTSGDANGLHILAAKAGDGYAWHTITTLSEPGFEADAWIGNVCVTGSGRRLAATYTPRTFTNSGALFTRGAFTAVVDLGTGRVTKLPLRASLAYYSPGCGIGESVVFTQPADEDSSRTRLVRVDAGNGKRAAAVEQTGQVTSAVPFADGTIAAADRHRIVGIGADGRRRALARTHAVPFTIVVGPDGGLTYLDHADGKGLVQHLPRKASRPSTVARGDLTGIGLTRDATGRAYVTGSATGERSGVAGTPALPKETLASTRGESFVTSTGWSAAGARQPDPTPAVEVALAIRSTGHRLHFTVDVTASGDPAGRGPSPVPGTATRQRIAAAAGSTTNPVEDERTCAVPRNDPRNQAGHTCTASTSTAITRSVPVGWRTLPRRPCRPVPIRSPSADRGPGSRPP
ncbi:hypothetical protein [Micromonospora lupini]|uniref:Uncharacterized protein n=1 Tax=Micromonospora lupini str. Lupac 08 TaxID=1150864 RepID=I0L1Z7_9ACTN|nr:hypothetical protein [Micromonospora lupini]CCH17844.1 conserved exported hypothetical protein [Micromonospora lupini str. Lupac 08]